MKQNNLSARDYLAGVPALRMALLVAYGLPQSNTVYAPPANIAFAKANLAQLDLPARPVPSQSGWYLTRFESLQ